MILEGREGFPLLCYLRREGRKSLVILEGREGYPLYLRRERVETGSLSVCVHYSESGACGSDYCLKNQKTRKNKQR